MIKTLFTLRKTALTRSIVVLALAVSILAAVPIQAGASAADNTENIRSFVTRLYNVCLGREPDAEGLYAWTYQLQNGLMSGGEAAQGFVFSREMANRHLSTGEFIEILYKTMLGRAPDLNGKVAWITRLGGGMSLQSAFEGFVQSAEFNGICENYGITAGGEFIEPIEMPEPSIPKPPVVYSGQLNPLTGEPLLRAVRNNRPWSVSIGNTSAALPLLGIGKADIICEYPIESGETRFMAIYQDVSDVEVIAGVRSLRTSSMEIARGFDSIYAHWGGLTYDGIIVGGLPISSYATYNAMAVGGRHPDRPGTHDAYVTGEQLISGLPSDFRTMRDAESINQFTFAADGTPKGLPAKNVTVSFSDVSRYAKVFDYNEADRKYYVQHIGRDLIDGIGGESLSFTNVIVLRTDMEFKMNAPGHTYIRTTGGGDGYFICGGAYTEIYWVRYEYPDEAPFMFFLKDGTPLTMGIGKSFICFTEDMQEPVFE